MRRGATPLSVGIVGALTQAVVTGRGFIVGWSLSETAAAATIARIFDGADANGQPITGGIVIGASGASVVPLTWPIEFKQGLFVTNTAGAIVGALWVLLVPDYFDDKFLDGALNLSTVAQL